MATVMATALTVVHGHGHSYADYSHSPTLSLTEGGSATLCQREPERAKGKQRPRKRSKEKISPNIKDQCPGLTSESPKPPSNKDPTTRTAHRTEPRNHNTGSKAQGTAPSQCNYTPLPTRTRQSGRGGRPLPRIIFGLLPLKG